MHTLFPRGTLGSPPPASEASGGEGLGVGGASFNRQSPPPRLVRFAHVADPPHHYVGEG